MDCSHAKSKTECPFCRNDVAGVYINREIVPALKYAVDNIASYQKRGKAAVKELLETILNKTLAESIIDNKRAIVMLFMHEHEKYMKPDDILDMLTTSEELSEWYTIDIDTIFGRSFSNELDIKDLKRSKLVASREVPTIIYEKRKYDSKLLSVSSLPDKFYSKTYIHCGNSEFPEYYMSSCVTGVGLSVKHHFISIV